MDAQPTLQSLIDAARRGDRNAFGQLVPLFLAAVIATALSIVNSRESAEDIAQLVFLRAWQNIRSLKADQAFASWLMTITRNTARNWLRDHAFEARRVEKELETVQAPGEAAAEDLFPIVRKLPEPLREVVLLRYVSDLSYDEIAAHTGQPLSVVRDRLYRAKLLLKDLLK